MFWINSRRYYFCVRAESNPLSCVLPMVMGYCEFICHKIDGGEEGNLSPSSSFAQPRLSKVTAFETLQFHVKSPLADNY
jgi:hypothetical protein